MTFEEFSEGWNKLHNAVAGRGMSRPAGVSPKLYEQVTTAYAEWRKWLDGVDLYKSLTTNPSVTRWMVGYRELVKSAKEEGIAVEELDANLLEAAANGLRTLGRPDVVKSVLVVAAIVCAVPVVLQVLQNAQAYRRAR